MIFLCASILGTIIGMIIISTIFVVLLEHSNKFKQCKKKYEDNLVNLFDYR